MASEAEVNSQEKELHVSEDEIISLESKLNALVCPTRLFDLFG
jgi:hypothetical protein